jgi:hypothetical protein
VARRAHRCLRSSVDAATATQEEIIGDRLDVAGTRVPIRRFQSSVPDAQTRGNIEAMPFWAASEKLLDFYSSLERAPMKLRAGTPEYVVALADFEERLDNILGVQTSGWSFAHTTQLGLVANAVRGFASVPTGLAGLNGRHAGRRGYPRRKRGAVTRSSSDVKGQREANVGGDQSCTSGQ